jgi:hypothetical protein
MGATDIQTSAVALCPLAALETIFNATGNPNFLLIAITSCLDVAGMLSTTGIRVSLRSALASISFSKVREVLFAFQ